MFEIYTVIQIYFCEKGFEQFLAMIMIFLYSNSYFNLMKSKYKICELLDLNRRMENNELKNIYQNFTKKKNY